MYLLEVIYVS